MKSSMSRRQAVVRTPVGNKTKRGAELEGTPKTPRAMETIMLISPATSRSMSVERMCLLQEAELSSFPPSRTRRPLHWSVNAKQGLALSAHHRHQQHNHHHHHLLLLHDAGINNTSDMSKNDKDYSLEKSSSAQMVTTTVEQKLNGGLHSIQVSSSSSSSSSSSPSPLSISSSSSSSSSSSAAALSPICLNAIAPASVNDQQQGDSCGFRLKKQSEPYTFYSKQPGFEWRESSRVSERGPPNLRRNGRVFVWSNAAFDQNMPVKTANDTSTGRADSCGSCDSSSLSSYHRQQETDSPDDAESPANGDGEMDHQQEGCFVDNSSPLEEHVQLTLQHSDETRSLQNEAFHVMRSEEETWQNEQSHVRSVEPAHEKLAMDEDVQDGPVAELLDSGDNLILEDGNKEVEVEAEAEAEAEASSGKAVLIRKIDAEIEVLTLRLTELQMQKQRWEGELKKKKKKNIMMTKKKTKRTEAIDHGDMAESGADDNLKNVSITTTDSSELVKGRGSSVVGSNTIELSPLTSGSAETKHGGASRVQGSSSTCGRKWSDGGGDEQEQRAKAYRRLSVSTTTATSTASGDGGGAKVLTKQLLQRDQEQRSSTVGNVMPSSCRSNGNVLPACNPNSTTITPSRIVASRYNARRSVTPASVKDSISSVSVVPNKKRDRTTCRSFASSPPLCPPHSRSTSAAAMAIAAAAALPASPAVTRAITTRSGYPSRSGLTTPVKSAPPSTLTSAPSICSIDPHHLRNSVSSRKQATTTSRSRSSSCHSHSQQQEQQELINSGPKSTAALYQCLESLVEDSKNFFKRISPVRSRSSSVSVAVAATPQPPPTPPLPCIYTCRSTTISSSSSSLSDAHHHRNHQDHAACDYSTATATATATATLSVKRPAEKRSFFAEKRSHHHQSMTKIGVEKDQSAGIDRVH